MTFFKVAMMPHGQNTYNSPLSQFKNHIQKLLPNIALLELNESQWAIFNKSIHERPLKRLSSINLLIQLSVITGKEINDLTTLLSTPPQSRSTRKINPIKPTPISNTRYSRRFKPYDLFNPIVMEKTIENKTLSTPKGIRKALLTSVNTPSHKPIPLKETPGGTRYRKLFSTQGNSLFSPNTPAIPRFFNPPQTPIDKKLPKLHYKRPHSSISYRVHLDQLEAVSGTKRRVSQRQLTGESAFAIFNAEGANLPEFTHGRNYHWSHLIAYFLGGLHLASNLVPTTASANYNILDAIERLIPQKLRTSQNKTDYVDINLTLRYDDEDENSLIPLELIYTLGWEEQGVLKNETHHIKPTSGTRYSEAMLQTFAALRDKANETDDDPTPDSPTYDL